jgi:cytochrome P450
VIAVAVPCNSSCSIGQNLAKLELQVVLATLLSRFRFSPGPELEQELQVAAATGRPVVTAVHALAGAYVSLQPLSGQMMLRVSACS